MVDGDDRTRAGHRARGGARAAAALHAELADVERALADPALADDLRRMTRLLERQVRLVEALGAQTVDGDAIRLLRDLGLDDAMLERARRGR